MDAELILESACSFCMSLARPMPENSFICIMSRGGGEEKACQFYAAVLCRSLICLCADELYSQAFGTGCESTDKLSLSLLPAKTKGQLSHLQKLEKTDAEGRSKPAHKVNSQIGTDPL